MTKKKDPKDKKKAVKKKPVVKNDKKTKSNGKVFSKEYQPEKRGRPAGLKDFTTIFHEVTDGKGRAELVKKIYEGIKNRDSGMIKLACEYLFNKPVQTVENINRNIDMTDEMTEEQLRNEIERIEKAL